MGVLSRFKDIMTSNINALLDKAEDPEKMIEQCLRNLNNDLGKVKAETAAIMAEETRAKRELDENVAEADKLQKYAVKALEAGNEADARKFLEKKGLVASKTPLFQQAYDLAHTNASHMREMHDKLVNDINELENRKDMIKTKMAVAKTQERINKMGSSLTGTNDTLGAFERMEAKANKRLDAAKAMSELNKAEQYDEFEELSSKYSGAGEASVDAELEALKAQMGLGSSSVDAELDALKNQVKEGK